jgi:FixJ family two-component response regulator
MEPIRILIIEDDEDYAFLEKDILTDELDCTINIVCSKESLKSEDILKSDIVLLDFNLPDITGDEILEIIREKIDIPVIIITGDEQLQIAIKTFKHGATDFLIKSPQNIALLPQIVKRILNEYKNKKLLEEERKEKEALNIKIETLRQVLTTLAHYINNSTTTIYGYAQLCEQDPSNVRRCKKLAKIGIKETEKITFVLQELEKIVNSMEVKTTKYVNIPDAMFAIDENIKKKMEELKKSLT